MLPWRATRIFDARPESLFIKAFYRSACPGASLSVLMIIMGMEAAQRMRLATSGPMVCHYAFIARWCMVSSVLVVGLLIHIDHRLQHSVALLVLAVMQLLPALIFRVLRPCELACPLRRILAYIVPPPPSNCPVGDRHRHCRSSSGLLRMIGGLTLVNI